MEVTQATVEAWVRTAVVAQLLDEPYDGGDPLADRHVDSLALEELIDMAEEQFGILLDEEETARENFSSVSRFAQVLLRNIGSSPWLQH